MSEIFKLHRVMTLVSSDAATRAPQLPRDEPTPVADIVPHSTWASPTLEVVSYQSILELPGVSRPGPLCRLCRTGVFVTEL